MQLTDKEVEELQKFKQHLHTLAKGRCQREGDKTCVEVPDANFCPSCYANSVLQTSEQPIQTGEPFIVHLDSIGAEPQLNIAMERQDKLYPLVTDDSTHPNVASLEMLLRFMGVVVDMVGDTDAFKKVASKWGLKFYITK